MARAPKTPATRWTPKFAVDQPVRLVPATLPGYMLRAHRDWLDQKLRIIEIESDATGPTDSPYWVQGPTGTTWLNESNLELWVDP